MVSEIELFEMVEEVKRTSYYRMNGLDSTYCLNGIAYDSSLDRFFLSFLLVRELFFNGF